MPDGRFLSKTIANDWELNSVSLEADYLFIRCVPHLDVEGRMPGHPSEVRGTAVPLRRGLSDLQVDVCLEELAKAGLVEWYEVNGRPCLQFPGFQRHQKGLRKEREADSRIPSPKVQAAQRITTVLRTNSGPTPEDSGSTPAEVEVKVEVKGEVKATESSSLRSSDSGSAEDVENSETGDHRSADEPDPEGVPTAPSADRPEYTKNQLLGAAKSVCGLDTWSRREETRANSILVQWYGEGRRPWEIWAAIHGARLMVDAGDVDWLKARQPFGLRALNHTGVLWDQGDGKAARPFFDAAQDAYYRQGNETRTRDAPSSGLESVGGILSRAQQQARSA